MTENEAKRYFNKYFKWWSENLGLGFWKITVIFRDIIGSDDGENYYTVMMCDPKWEYRIATITVDIHRACSFTEDELERYIVHELCHCLVSPMDNNQSRKDVEHTVTMLTDAFLWVKKRLVKEKSNEK